MNSNMEKPYVVGIDIGGTNTVLELLTHAELLLPAAQSKLPVILLPKNMLTKFARICFR